MPKIAPAATIAQGVQAFKMRSKSGVGERPKLINNNERDDNFRMTEYTKKGGVTRTNAILM